MYFKMNKNEPFVYLSVLIPSDRPICLASIINLKSLMIELSNLLINCTFLEKH